MSNTAKKMRKVFVKALTSRGRHQENLWAEVVNANTVKIQNIPFLSDTVAYDDLVRVSRSGKVLKVLKRTTRTVRATYEAATNREEALREFKAICNHLLPSNIECESAAPGMIGLAIPLDLTNEQLVDLCKQCPVSLKLRL